MKTGKKVLIALLSATCMVTGAFGIAACKGGGSQDSALLGVYNEYVETCLRGKHLRRMSNGLKTFLTPQQRPGRTVKTGRTDRTDRTVNPARMVQTVNPHTRFTATQSMRLEERPWLRLIGLQALSGLRG